jgi:hypothetical protein
MMPFSPEILPKCHKKSGPANIAREKAQDITGAFV